LDPVFDKNGVVGGWLYHDDTIVDRIGEYRAIVSNGSVFDYQAIFMGTIHDGYIWDRDGNAVGFFVGAVNGPVLPPLGAIPRPPVAGPEPARPSPPPVPDQIPAYSMEWSKMRWPEFLGGRPEQTPRPY
jgi:hypothetical protein